jgi:hypothetical protein
MPCCKKCFNTFPNWTSVGGERKNLSRRKYCLNCSPFGLHNTAKLHEPSKDNKQYYRTYFKSRLKKLRTKVLEELGGAVCCECGCDVEEIIEINHKNGGGNQDRKHRSALAFYGDLLKGRLSMGDFNVMCRICNAHHYVRDIMGVTGFTIKFNAV